jgi:hypothetical protein
MLKRMAGARSRLAIARELIRFLAIRKRYWLIPLVCALVLLGLLLVFAQASPVAPFIYTIF